MKTCSIVIVLIIAVIICSGLSNAGCPSTSQRSPFTTSLAAGLGMINNWPGSGYTGPTSGVSSESGQILRQLINYYLGSAKQQKEKSGDMQQGDMPQELADAAALDLVFFYDKEGRQVASSTGSSSVVNNGPASYSGSSPSAIDKYITQNSENELLKSLFKQSSIKSKGSASPASPTPWRFEYMVIVMMMGLEKLASMDQNNPDREYLIQNLENIFDAMEMAAFLSGMSEDEFDDLHDRIDDLFIDEFKGNPSDLDDIT
jgi:hypothetical protein